MSAYKFICHFPVIQQHFDSGLLCHLITSPDLPDFQTGIGAAAHATLDRGICLHTRTTFVDTVTYLQGSDKRTNYSFRSAWIHRIHNILDNAVLKWVGNTVYIIAYPFNLLPGSVVKSGLPSFPFFTTLMILSLLIRLAFIMTSTFLQQSSVGLSHSSSCVRGARGKPRLGCTETTHMVVWLCLLGTEASLGF